MKKYLFISVSLIILLFSCKKEDLSYLHKYPGLPDATQSGENTMGCLINGVPWIANIENPSFFSSLRRLQANYGENRESQNDYDKYFLKINCKKIAEKDEKLTNGYRISEDFDIYLRPVNKIGQYQKYDFNFFKFNYSIYNDITGKSKSYIIDSTAIQKIQITKIDTINNIISGLFELKLIRISDNSDSLKITNGRFDANYYTL